MLEEVPAEDAQTPETHADAGTGRSREDRRRQGRHLGRRRLRVFLRRVPRRRLPAAAAAGSQRAPADREHAVDEELAGRPPDVAAEPADGRRRSRATSARPSSATSTTTATWSPRSTRSPRSATGTSAVVERALEHVQAFDPIGVGARDLQECLLLQLRHLGLGRHAGRNARPRSPAPAAEPPDSGAGQGAGHRARRDQGAHRVHQAPRSEAGRALQPGRLAVRHPRRLHRQDRRRVQGGAERRRAAAAAHQPGLPPAARQGRRDVRRDARLREGQVPVGALAAEVRRPAAEDDPQGRDEHHQLPARRSSITGIEHLRPLVLRDVANDIGMHESTVSRVVNNKYMHTPQGVYEMKFFFHSGISSSFGESVSSVTIKQRIKKIIEAEDAAAPAQRLEDHEHPPEGRPRAGAADDREVPRGAEDPDVEPAQGPVLTRTGARLTAMKLTVTGRHVDRHRPPLAPTSRRRLATPARASSTTARSPAQCVVSRERADVRLRADGARARGSHAARGGPRHAAARWPCRRRSRRSGSRPARLADRWKTRKRADGSGAGARRRARGRTAPPTPARRAIARLRRSSR